jgi:hypothetical protein
MALRNLSLEDYRLENAGAKRQDRALDEILADQFGTYPSLRHSAIDP